jgi:hypothetical protein
MAWFPMNHPALLGVGSSAAMAFASYVAAIKCQFVLSLSNLAARCRTSRAAALAVSQTKGAAVASSPLPRPPPPEQGPRDA